MPWLDIAHAATYTCLSVRTLHHYLTDPAHRLPARRVGGKWVVAQEDLDAWLKGFAKAGEAEDRLVEQLMQRMQR